MSDESSTAREVAMKAFERLFPAFGYIYAAKAGMLAANVIVLSTWIMTRVRGSKIKSLEDAKRQDRLRLIELSSMIDERKRRIEELKRQADIEGDERRKKVLQDLINVEENALDRMMEEYELVQLRLLAINRIWELNDMKLIKNVERIIKDIQEGRIEKTQYEVLSKLEEMWRKREIEYVALKRMIQEG